MICGMGFEKDLHFYGGSLKVIFMHLDDELQKTFNAFNLKTFRKLTGGGID